MSTVRRRYARDAREMRSRCAPRATSCVLFLIHIVGNAPVDIALRNRHEAVVMAIIDNEHNNRRISSNSRGSSSCNGSVGEGRHNNELVRDEHMQIAAAMGLDGLAEAIRKHRRGEWWWGTGGGARSGSALPRGTRVRVSAMVTRGECDGRLGVVSAYDDASGTYTVTLDGDGELIRHVHAENLFEDDDRCAAAPASAAASAESNSSSAGAAGSALHAHDELGIDPYGVPIWLRMPKWIERGSAEE